MQSELFFEGSLEMIDTDRLQSVSYIQRPSPSDANGLAWYVQSAGGPDLARAASTLNSPVDLADLRKPNSYGRSVRIRKRETLPFGIVCVVRL